ncbi:MAG: hypothetical protein JST59_17200, partial [Actinobacteria bacterium]|nr:hypothetical protein [Actinomycetota bacterium]
MKGTALLVLIALLAALALSACGGGGSSSSSEATESSATESESESGAAETEKGSAEGGEAETASSGSGEWCGEEGITLGIQDGGGLNNWSKESQEQVQMVAKECPAVEKEIVVDADFEPQKA